MRLSGFSSVGVPRIRFGFKKKSLEVRPRTILPTSFPDNEVLALLKGNRGRPVRGTLVITSRDPVPSFFFYKRGSRGKQRRPRGSEAFDVTFRRTKYAAEGFTRSWEPEGMGIINKRRIPDPDPGAG